MESALFQSLPVTLEQFIPDQIKTTACLSFFLRIELRPFYSAVPFGLFFFCFYDVVLFILVFF